MISLIIGRLLVETHSLFLYFKLLKISAYRDTLDRIINN